ncbi:17266_t:CDS:1 [Funneliformis caledonium]|uniref:17266_t:CDS:1 n=2 Tax=Funneliformis TaxID=1117308 RepID=A0A9N9B901_9GLOM|nr:215_t:CDS:1 [Funneliformis mosseae]CAG8555355.1 17266_t:CDS:1 [Funneliformis caledonium]
MPKVNNRKSYKFDLNKIKERIIIHLDAMSKEGIHFPTNLPLIDLLTPCTPNSKYKGRIMYSQNSFFLYRKDIRNEILRQHPNASLKAITTISSERWKNESVEKRNFFAVLSRISTLIHNELSGKSSQLNNEGLLWPTEIPSMATLQNSFYLQQTRVTNEFQHQSFTSSNTDNSDQETGRSKFLKIQNLIN